MEVARQIRRLVGSQNFVKRALVRTHSREAAWTGRDQAWLRFEVFVCTRCELHSRRGEINFIYICIYIK